ncbi:MAG: efflux RND transporter periplasmic adaptor subunit [Gammaproteobacteria bacterium]
MARLLVRGVLILVVLAATGGAMVYLEQRKAAEIAAMGTRSMPPAAVSVATVEAEQWRQSLFAVGSLAADQGIDVTVPLPGTVIEINFESGQTTRRGQVLLSMDIGIEQAELEGLQAALDLRELQYERARRLRDDKQIAQSELDAARAARDEAEAALGAKQAYIARKKVYAPFDGVLGIRGVDLGTYLEPGDPVVQLQALAPIHVDYAVPEQFLSRLELGQAVEIAVPAYPGEVFEGHITAFEPGIERATRSLRVRATLPNRDHRLRPGMFAEVWTIADGSKDVLALPRTAVTYSPYGNTVYVIVAGKEGTSVERRQIQTGEVRDGRVEVVAGLARDDRVVAVGQNKLRNGMAVEIVETMAAAKAGGTP